MDQKLNDGNVCERHGCEFESQVNRNEYKTHTHDKLSNVTPLANNSNNNDHNNAHNNKTNTHSIHKNNNNSDVTASKRWKTNLEHQHFHRNHTNITRQLQYSDELTPYIGISEGARVIGDALWDDSNGDFTLDGINHHMPLKTIYELEKFRVDMQNLTGGRGGQCLNVL